MFVLPFMVNKDVWAIKGEKNEWRKGKKGKESGV